MCRSRAGTIDSATLVHTSFQALGKGIEQANGNIIDPIYVLSELLRLFA